MAREWTPELARPWDNFHWSIGSLSDPFRAVWGPYTTQLSHARAWLVIEGYSNILAVYEDRYEARDHLVLLRLMNGLNEDGTKA